MTGNGFEINDSPPWRGKGWVYGLAKEKVLENKNETIQYLPVLKFEITLVTLIDSTDLK